MKFNKLYESIFKPASAEEVKTRKKEYDLERFKTRLERNFSIKYEDLFKPENINKQNRWGSTPLMLAARNNFTDIVKQLLEAGADPNIDDNNGLTALDLTCDYDYYNKDIADLLKSYGAKE